MFVVEQPNKASRMFSTYASALSFIKEFSLTIAARYEVAGVVTLVCTNVR